MGKRDMGASFGVAMRRAQEADRLAARQWRATQLERVRAERGGPHPFESASQGMRAFASAMRGLQEEQT